MRLPFDTPEWVEKLVESAEEKATNMLAKVTTADEALKAAGAYTFWTFIKGEIEVEYANQTQVLKERDAKLHERN